MSSANGRDGARAPFRPTRSNDGAILRRARGRIVQSNSGAILRDLSGRSKLADVSQSLQNINAVMNSPTQLPTITRQGGAGGTVTVLYSSRHTIKFSFDVGAASPTGFAFDWATDYHPYVYDVCGPLICINIATGATIHGAINNPRIKGFDAPLYGALAAGASYMCYVRAYPKIHNP